MKKLFSWARKGRAASPAAGSSSANWQAAIRPYATRLIQGTYITLLGREADQPGLEHWLQFFEKRGDFNALLKGFINSPEFQARQVQLMQAAETLIAQGNTAAPASPPPAAPEREVHEPPPELLTPRPQVVAAVEPPARGPEAVEPSGAAPGPAEPPAAAAPGSGQPEQAQPAAGSRTTTLSFAVVGNCQMGVVARCIQALVGGPMPLRLMMHDASIARINEGSDELAEVLEKHDRVLLQPWLWTAVRSRHLQYQHKVVLFPYITFHAYHPDLIALERRDTGQPMEEGPTLRSHSAIALLAWRAGLTVRQALDLYSADTYRKLGYFGGWSHSVRALVEEGNLCGLDLEGFIKSWAARDCFMHCHVHPKLFAVADLTREVLRRQGVEMFPGDPVRHVHDFLANGLVWPVYPEIAEPLGIRGSYQFKLLAPHFMPDQPVQQLDLHDLLEASFNTFASHESRFGAGNLVCEYLDQPVFREFQESLRPPEPPRLPPAAPALPAPAESHGANPYHGLPPQRFWRRAIQDVPCERVDLVGQTKFQLDADTRIAAAGSCFAQHIATRLRARQFNVLQTEQPPQGMTPAELRRDNYGVFCARYGNIYTVRHLLQLMQRAYGEFEPQESAWSRGDGRLVDPFRPQIQEHGFGSPAELEAARTTHLAAVRQMFESLDVFVFTLGLTEAWRSRRDGAVFPLAPGVAGGAMDFDRYEFVNFSAAEVDADLAAFMQRLARINPAARVLLTVSPVPLAATYAERNVLVATTYSKAVLRVAAEQVTARHSNCDYFPSYEIITGSYNRGAYFASDLRSVTDAGVDHVMRLFFRHYAQQLVPEPDAAPPPVHAPRFTPVVCEEELLAAAAR